MSDTNLTVTLLDSATLRRTAECAGNLRRGIRAQATVGLQVSHGSDYDTINQPYSPNQSDSHQTPNAKLILTLPLKRPNIKRVSFLWREKRILLSY